MNFQDFIISKLYIACNTNSKVRDRGKFDPTFDFDGTLPQSIPHLPLLCDLPLGPRPKGTIV